MKNVVLCVLLVLGFASLGWSDSGGLNTTNVSTKVLPLTGVKSAKAFALTNAYVNGTYVRSSSGQFLMCLVPGTSTNLQPTGNGVISVGSAKFISVPTQPRKGVYFCNMSGAIPVFLSFGSVATLNSGVRLDPGEEFKCENPPDSEVSVISTGVCPVAFMDW